jgi:hypothetical protein
MVSAALHIVQRVVQVLYYLYHGTGCPEILHRNTFIERFRAYVLPGGVPYDRQGQGLCRRGVRGRPVDVAAVAQGFAVHLYH